MTIRTQMINNLYRDIHNILPHNKAALLLFLIESDISKDNRISKREPVFVSNIEKLLWSDSIINLSNAITAMTMHNKNTSYSLSDTWLQLLNSYTSDYFKVYKGIYKLSNPSKPILTVSDSITITYKNIKQHGVLIDIDNNPLTLTIQQNNGSNFTITLDESTTVSINSATNNVIINGTNYLTLYASYPHPNPLLYNLLIQYMYVKYIDSPITTEKLSPSLSTQYSMFCNINYSRTINNKLSILEDVFTDITNRIQKDQRNLFSELNDYEFSPYIFYRIDIQGNMLIIEPYADLGRLLMYLDDITLLDDKIGVYKRLERLIKYYKESILTS